MHILTVEYRQLKSFGNYNNEVVGATAALQAGETPEKLLAELRSWVGEQLGARENVASEADRVHSLRDEAASLKRDIARDKKIYLQLRKLLGKHGVKLRDDVPF